MKKRMIATITASALCVLANAAPQKQAELSVIGYSRPTSLENFPVLVRVSESNISGFSYADCAVDGRDVAFEDAAGNVLSREIESWNRNGESLIWVRLPVLADNVVFKMTWGDGSVAAQPASQTDGSVWRPAGYIGVWHMDEAAGAVADATAHGLTATPAGNAANSIAVPGGPVGNARQTATSAEKGYLSAPGYDSFDVGSTFTMSGWMKMDGFTGYPRPFSRKNSYTDDNGWEIEMSSSYTKFDARGRKNDKICGSLFPTSFQDTWAHIVLVYNDATLSVYQNGTLVHSAAIDAATDNGLPLSIGCNANGSEAYIQGAFDECRLLDAVAPADWIMAEYATQSSAFLSYGSASSYDASSGLVFKSKFTFTSELTVAGYEGETTLANFPVLVRVSESNISGFDYDDCAVDGADVRFLDASGNQLPREIEAWNPNGESLVWVRIPVLADGATFTMVWGAPTFTAQPISQTDGSVWRRAGYVGVWHMDEADGAVADATAHNLDATPMGNTVNSIAVPGGPVGNARQTATSAGKGYLSMPNYDSFGVGSTFTMSGWMKMTGIASYPRPFSRKSNYTDNDGWEIEMSQSYTAFAARGRNNVTCSGGFPQTLENNWAHVALIYNDSTLSVYQNGELVKSASIDNATDNALPLSIGCNSNGSETYIQGAFDECRLLDAVAPPDWLKAEYGTVHAPDFLSYGAAELMMSGGTLLVMGSPSKIGSPTPPYGSTENLASNQTVTLSMPATMVAGAGSVTNYLVGWKIESIDLETGAAELLRTSADANEVVDSCLYTHSGVAVFTWLWDVRDKPGVGAPTLVSNDGVSLALSAEVTGAGYTGTPATLKFAYGLSPDNLAATGTVSTAVVSPGTVTGVIGGLTSGNYYYVRAVLESDAGTIASPIVSFPAGTPNLLHVSTLGDDSAGNGSPLTPYATIAKALARAGEGCEIRVAGGLYVEDLVSTVSDVTVSGSWLDDFSARDLRNHRTVIKATASSKDCYTVSGSVTTSNTLCGVDLTGGRYGFFFQGMNQRDTKTFNTLYQCVVSNCTIGVHAERGDGLALLSCLLADNAEDGVYARYDTGGPGWYYNCTFARNGRAGAYRAHPYCMDRQHRNCVFVDNASAFYTEHGFSKSAYFENVLWYGNGQDIYYAAGAVPDGRFDSGISLTGVQLRADPKLGADFTPAAGSPCIGAGGNFSADPKVPFDADLYGTPWGDSWGLGCVKGAGPANAKLADVYVSPSGSDANDGATPATAKSSIGEAMAILADGGTCHVANGEYTGGVFVSATNATLVGESRGGVVVQGVAVPSGATGYSATRHDFAIAILTGDVAVSNMTFRNAYAGAMLTSTKATRDTRFENCLFTGCHVGLSLSKRDYQKTCWTRLSHCAFVANGARGIYDIGSLRLDNCLIADNGGYGIYSDSWDQDAKCHFAFCTFTANGAYGYYNDGGDSAWGTFANCVFEGHATAGIHARNTFTAKSCCFHNNAADTEKNTKRNTSPTLADSVFGDPLLNASAALRGHPGEGSACAQAGIAYPDDPMDVADDLGYVARLADKVDIGCYISVETMKDLAGNGYHILTVAGDPDGYGAPTPAYGGNLLPDGTLAIDLSTMLETSAFDGARVAFVADGVRAVYNGYDYVEEGGAAPLYSSDSAEALTIANWRTNATLTLKWTLQYRVTASTASPGCTVSVGGCAPAACVTNWFAPGVTYPLVFTPSPDYAFDAWTGDFQEGAEYRTATTSATSDRPRAITVATRPVLHVSASAGDDATGDGSRSKPFATIGRALSAASARSVIYVQGGVYAEAVANSALDELTLAGGFNAVWERDLRGTPSFIIPPSSASDCIQLTGVVSNTVKGFVLTGGNYGIRMAGPSTQPAVDDRAVRVNNFEQLVVTNNAGVGIACPTSGYCGFRIVSCLIAGNGGAGIHWRSDNRGWGYIHNCTVVGNGGNGVELHYGYSLFDVRNTISAFNGGKYGFSMSRAADNQHSINFQMLGGVCAYGAAAADFQWNAFLYRDEYEGRVRPLSYLGLRQRIFFQDPLLGDDFAPLAGSPCIGTGDDLTAYPMRAELEDLYGTPWNGSYNIGCIKGGVAAPARTATDVYVAPGGDDANDGLSAATPMASVQKALAKLADNGTCHLAAGTYTEPIGIYVRGATLQGAGMGLTIVRGKDNPDGTPHPFNIFAAADDVTVRDLTTTAGSAGIRFGYSEFAKRIAVRDCEAIGNTNGFYCAAMSLPLNGITPKTYSLLPDCIDERPTDALVSHCRLTDNRECGLCTTGAGRDDQGGPFNATIVNSLFARNGEDGLRLQDARQMTHRLYYCTMVDNGGVGLWNGAYNDASYIDAANCVIVGNAVGLQRANYSGAHAEYSLISGNGIDIGTSSGTSQQPTTTACSFAPANLDPLPSRRHYAHLAETSPAVGLARALTADDTVAEPLDDLDHRTRKPLKHRDAGCFAYGLQEGTKLILR